MKIWKNLTLQNFDQFESRFHPTQKGFFAATGLKCFFFRNQLKLCQESVSQLTISKNLVHALEKKESEEKLKC